MTSSGACRGGNYPKNDAGKHIFTDKDCRERCNENPTCSGFVLPNDGASWCETFTSIGATGDGRSQFTCFMKPGNVINYV